MGGFGGGGAFVWQKEAEEHEVDEDVPIALVEVWEDRSMLENIHKLNEC